MTHTAIVTFTGRSPERVVSEGGSQAWKLDRERTRLTEFLVCTQNKADPHDLGATEEHGAAFLVGRISGVSPSVEREGGYLIEISEYAKVRIPKVWAGWRNPVRYSSLEELGIDLATLTFESLPPSDTVDGGSVETETAPPLTIAEAKAGLAATFGVPSSAVEIVIHA